MIIYCIKHEETGSWCGGERTSVLLTLEEAVSADTHQKVCEDCLRGVAMSSLRSMLQADDDTRDLPMWSEIAFELQEFVLSKLTLATSEVLCDASSFAIDAEILMRADKELQDLDKGDRASLLHHSIGAQYRRNSEVRKARALDIAEAVLLKLVLPAERPAEQEKSEADE